MGADNAREARLYQEIVFAVRARGARIMTSDLHLKEIDNYEVENKKQSCAETDSFTAARYRQFADHAPARTNVILDVGCGPGRGGVELALKLPAAEIWGLDVVQSRLDQLPAVYSRGIRGLSTEIPMHDQSVDLIVAGEFLEHLRPHDIDKTLCEFQRVLRVSGRLVLTTPNPNYVRLRLRGGTVYGPGHLTQHYAPVLKTRLRAHGFSRVRIRGSGRVSSIIGNRVPLLPLYGSYLAVAEKR